MSEIAALLEQAKHHARLALQTREPQAKERSIAMAQEFMDRAEALTRREMERAAGRGDRKPRNRNP